MISSFVFTFANLAVWFWCWMITIVAGVFVSCCCAPHMCPSYLLQTMKYSFLEDCPIDWDYNLLNPLSGDPYKSMLGRILLNKFVFINFFMSFGEMIKICRWLKPIRQSSFRRMHVSCTRTSIRYQTSENTLSIEIGYYNVLVIQTELAVWGPSKELPVV